jgi:hypothetical protein
MPLRDHSKIRELRDSSASERDFNITLGDPLHGELREVESVKEALPLVCGKPAASDISDADVYVTNARVMKLLRPDFNLVRSALYFRQIFLGGLPARKRYE